VDVATCRTYYYKNDFKSVCLRPSLLIIYRDEHSNVTDFDNRYCGICFTIIGIFGTYKIYRNLSNFIKSSNVIFFFIQTSPKNETVQKSSIYFL